MEQAAGTRRMSWQVNGVTTLWVPDKLFLGPQCVRKPQGFLPIFSVMPLSPSFTDDGLFYFGEDNLQGTSFPTMRQLGIATQWVQLSNDGSELVYFFFVMNFSNSTIEYAFLESDV
jgi:hypothetical protein